MPIAAPPAESPEGAPRASLPAECPNCGAALKDRFCSACGQDCGNLSLDLRAQLREAVGQILGWDGSLLRTMRGLWRNPGALALDYVRGRRKSYLHPARFCFISLALWLLALKLADMDVLSAAGIEFSAGEGERHAVIEDIKGFLTQHFDWLLFLFLPVRALFFRLAFRRSGHTVGACLVPVLFVNGFGSLVGVLLVGAGAFIAGDAFQLRPAIAMVWTIRATRDFFDVGWFEATFKSVLVVMAHVVAMIVIVALVAAPWIYLKG